MNRAIYLIERLDQADYDEFTAMVVIDKTANDAKQFTITKYPDSRWVKVGMLKATRIGTTDRKRAIVLASFKAG